MTTINLAAFQKPKAVTADAPRADWQSLDVATLSPDLQSEYFAYRKAIDSANAARKRFEAAMADKLDLPAHLALAFGYKFGKLSVALVPAERPKSTARAALSLEQLIAKADRA